MPMLTAKILQEFEAVLGRDRVRTSKEDLLSYAYDAYVEEYLPEAVLFPKTAVEVSKILKVASAQRISITPRGAGSGLAGGSLAKKGGVVLRGSICQRRLA